MMNRADKVMVAVKKAESQGYEFLGKGTGKYDEALASNREAGYDVRCWYTNMKGDTLTWIMYGRVKGQRRPSAKAIVDYASMTVKDLKKLCSEKKVTGYSKMNKDQMIESLQAC